MAVDRATSYIYECILAEWTCVNFYFPANLEFSKSTCDTFTFLYFAVQRDIAHWQKFLDTIRSRFKFNLFEVLIAHTRTYMKSTSNSQLKQTSSIFLSASFLPIPSFCNSQIIHRFRLMLFVEACIYWALLFQSLKGDYCLLLFPSLFDFIYCRKLLGFFCYS